MPELPPHLDPRGRRHAQRSSRGSRASSLRPIGRVLGALLSAALLVLSGYVWLTFRDLNSGVSRLQIAGQNKAPSQAAQVPAQDQNILLVGNDDRSNMTAAESRILHAGKDGGSLATDTMMIVHIPANGKRATLISLPRDSWVHIKGFGMGKLNSAYAQAYVNAKGDLKAKRSAGAGLLVDTISELTGLTINHYVQVDLLGFYRISTALGGVPVNMCRNVNDTRAYNASQGVSGGSGFKITKGKHSISGAQALAFVRQRHNFPDGREDLDRVKRQQYFLTAAFRQVASVGVLFKLRSLKDAITKSVYLDGSLDLLELGRQLENLTANNITGKTIPTTPATLSDGTDILSVNPTQVRAFMKSVLNPPAPTSAAPAPTPSRTKASSAASPSTAKAKTAIDAKCIN